MQLLSDVLTSDWVGPDGAATSVAQGLEGSTPWGTSYNLYNLKVARDKQGSTASSSLVCPNTAITELTTGSNSPSTDSTNLRVTMQHKSGTALIWHDNAQAKPWNWDNRQETWKPNNHKISTLCSSSSGVKSV